MFARKHVARLTTFRPFSPTQAGVGILGKRQFTAAIQNGFLDLAIALPWPTSVPPYSSTIILLTVVSRLALTVPFSVWVSLCVDMLYWSLAASYTARRLKDNGRSRGRLVIPRLREAKPLVEKQVVHEMRIERAGGTKGGAPQGVKLASEFKKLYACVHAPVLKSFTHPLIYSFTRPDARTTQ